MNALLFTAAGQMLIPSRSFFIFLAGYTITPLIIVSSLIIMKTGKTSAHEVVLNGLAVAFILELDNTAFALYMSKKQKKKTVDVCKRAIKACETGWATPCAKERAAKERLQFWAKPPMSLFFKLLYQFLFLNCWFVLFFARVAAHGCQYKGLEKGNNASLEATASTAARVTSLYFGGYNILKTVWQIREIFCCSKSSTIDTVGKRARLKALGVTMYEIVLGFAITEGVMAIGNISMANQ